jgi:hypothetical protein
MRFLPVIALVLAVTVSASAAPPMSDEAIADALIQQSTERYWATGDRCACPDNLSASGWPCGRQSVYSRLGGASPMCYRNQVTPHMILQWRYGGSSDGGALTTVPTVKRGAAGGEQAGIGSCSRSLDS